MGGKRIGRYLFIRKIKGHSRVNKEKSSKLQNWRVKRVETQDFRFYFFLHQRLSYAWNLCVHCTHCLILRNTNCLHSFLKASFEVEGKFKNYKIKKRPRNFGTFETNFVTFHRSFVLCLNFGSVFVFPLRSLIYEFL